MRTISAPLRAAFLAGTRATLLKITTKSGQVYGYTDHDFPLTVDSLIHKPAPGLKRTNLSATVNDQVSNQEIASAWVDAPETDLLSGKMDNATVEISFCSWADPSLGKVIIDKGVIGVIQWTADGFRADLQSHMRELTRNLNFVYTASCRHKLYSAFSDQTIGACTLNASSYTTSGTVGTVLVPKMKFETSLGQPLGWFNNGILTWTTGNNAGLKHEVKNHTISTGGYLEFFLPTLANIQTGDTFTVTAGCDKTVATCKNKFNNVLNFGGFPHIQAEVQYR